MSEPIKAARIAEAHYRHAYESYGNVRSYSPRIKDSVQFSKEALDKLKTYTPEKDNFSKERDTEKDSELQKNLSILKLDSGATPEEVKKAYIAAIKRYHPDKFITLPPEFRKLAEEKAKEINSAYSILKTL